MTKYKVITLHHFERSLEKFLDSCSLPEKNKFRTFQEIFDIDPFDRRIGTHQIHKDIHRNATLYSSIITGRIRLLWILRQGKIIVLNELMTDHDYHRIQKYIASILKIIDNLE